MDAMFLEDKGEGGIMTFIFTHGSVSVSESWKLPLVRAPGLLTTRQRDFKDNVLRQKGQLHKQKSRTEGKGRVQPSLLGASPLILLPEIVCPSLRALCSQWL